VDGKTMTNRFTIHENDKRLEIAGPEGRDFELNIFIDYDDVWHEQVMKQAKQLCRILDEHWPKQKAK
jgi:hypothetical protein